MLDKGFAKRKPAEDCVADILGLPPGAQGNSPAFGALAKFSTVVLFLATCSALAVIVCLLGADLPPPPLAWCARLRL